MQKRIELSNKHSIGFVLNLQIITRNEFYTKHISLSEQ